jgi:predicted helicase
VHGYWEAKDSSDDLDKEIKKKFSVGYPKNNILFQAPNRIVIWQDSKNVFDSDISKPETLIEGLKLFFEYEAPAIEQWEKAVDEFKFKVRELATGVLELIEKERHTNTTFVQAFDDFVLLCKETINPDIAIQAVEEMLIQHLLTERIFRKVFNNPDFVERNVIAHEVEKVIVALTSQSFSRAEFLKPLDRFYGAIETTAATIDDFTQKQSFLNTVYEKFFQGFSVKVADTHGIVYTPQPIVKFMVKSVEHILQKEFGRSLSDSGVHIIDPFVGTGNFILWIMREIQRSKLPYKYANELHCNEVMLLPYYIASMNIEHEYYEATGEYKAFEGICLVDTFDTSKQQASLFVRANTARVRKQQNSPIFVVIGNPPYNAKQVNENDNNKNRKYAIDTEISKTYAKDSKATNKNALSDPYVKAIYWASKRIGKEGIIAFVTNNSFIDGIAFDGMRKHLANDFSKIYHVNLKGDARTSGEQRRREAGNIFHDTIRVSVGITFLVRTKDSDKTSIYLYSVDDYLGSEEKGKILLDVEDVGKLAMSQLAPDENYTWLTEGLDKEFQYFLPLGTKEAKSGDDEKTIFKNFSNGVKTNRDTWVYNFNYEELSENVKKTIEVYNEQVYKLGRLKTKPNIDDFVLNDETQISWSEGLKNSLRRQTSIDYDNSLFVHSLYRPFTNMQLYFDKHLNERSYQMPYIFPTAHSENYVIGLSGIGSSKPFHTLMTNIIPCLDMLEKTQCFPFYTYSEDGNTRQENITDWAITQYQTQYKDSSLSKKDIFNYVYAILHHPLYREKYAANLKRELPRIPFAPDFWGFARAGKQLAELHVNYEKQPEYKLTWIEEETTKVHYRVNKMTLSKDKTQIVYNDFLTLGGIPPETFEYRLGNRSALDWIIDQYQVSIDKRSGITNDPNRLDDPQYIVRLIGKVITVSLETMKLVKSLPALD